MPRTGSLLIVLAVLGLSFWWMERQTPSAPAHEQIDGEVRDDLGPVAGAKVRIKGRVDFAVSDEQGRFHLAAAPGAFRVTAAKEGYFIAGVPAHAQPMILQLQQLPEEDCERYIWVDPTPDARRPANCGNCHAAIHDEWNSSGHARSATNQRFLSLYEDLQKDHPLGADVCASCHAPTQAPGPFGEFDIHDAAKASVGRSGVHCDFCHKAARPGTGEFGLSHGRYQLGLRRPSAPEDRQLFFGPLDDVDRGDDASSQFQRDSRLCAACHEGVVFGVPVYSTYSEWLASPASRSGTSCQHCHMAPTGAMTNIAPGHGGIRRDPATLGNHRFFDGSQLDMLRRGLKLEADARRTDRGIEVTVSLTVHDVGHRVPTGFIDRQLILFVDAYVGESALPIYHGPVLPKALGPDEAGRPGKMYARFLTDGATATPQPFWKGNPATLMDTRLQPNESDRSTFLFPAKTERVRIRLVHRHLWKAMTAAKGWPADELAIVDEVLIPH
jgi:Cytochrome c554 and c-prime